MTSRGIWAEVVSGPFVIDSTVTAHVYQELVQSRTILDTGQNYDLGTVIWLKDEFPTNFGRIIGTFLH